MGDDEFEKDSTVVGDRRALMKQLREQTRRAKQEAYLIVISGPDTGEMYPVANGGIIGRGETAQIRLTDEEASREHARIVLKDGVLVLEDLESTNGTFVNGQLIDERQLNNGDRVQIATTTILKFSYQDSLEEQFQRRMFQSAMRDGLTGAFNKQYLEDKLENELAYSKRHNAPMTLLLLDLDHFKKLNDTYGHQAGDHVLAEFASVVIETIRLEDVFARFGGEEFAVVSRGLTLDEGALFAERLRGLTANTKFEYDGQTIEVTVSIGVAHYPQESVQTVKDLVAKADQALYRAKEQGRNQVAVFQAE